MRYLKGFTENYNNDVIVDFCNQHLTSLLEDEGYALTVNEYNYRSLHNINYSANVSSKSFEIIIFKNDNYLEWDKFKLDFLPFVELLLSNFKVRVMRGRSVKTGDPRNNIITMNGQTITKEEILDSNFKPQQEKIRKVIIIVDSKRSNVYK